MEAASQAASGTMRGRRFAASLPFWVLVGAALGILTGVTLGERTAILHPLGVVYAMMLESVVYPYILSSLIVGLGSLASARTPRLVRARWAAGDAPDALPPNATRHSPESQTDALSRFDPTHPAQRRKSQWPRYLAKFHRCHMPG